MLRTTGEAQANCSITGAVGAETTLKTRRKSFWFLTVTMAFTIMAVSICSYGQELRPVKGLYGKWGFVNERGEEVIPFIYNDVGDFSEGVARVKLNKKWGFIDKEGKRIIPCKYDDAGDFSEGLARICDDVNEWGDPKYFKWGFIDKKGKEIISCIYEDVGDFSEGLARVKLNKKWGFIDKTGEEVIPLIYRDVDDFSEGVARVKYAGKWFFINEIGKEVIYTETISEKAEKESQEKEKAVALEQERMALELEKVALEREKVALEREKRETQTQEKTEQKITNTATTNTYDVILLKDGQEFKAKVTEIMPTEIKYKAFENLDGPTRTLAKSDVFLINYANGTREVFGTASKASEPNNKQTVKNHFQGAALGVNALTGFTFHSGDLVDGGLGARFSYTFPVPIRLAGEFDILWGKTSVYGAAVSTRWIDYGAYIQYLFLGKNKNFATYPLVGFGGINFKATAKYQSNTAAESTNWYSTTVGWGVEGRYNHFTYGTEMRVKLITENGVTEYRIHLVAGIGYKF